MAYVMALQQGWPTSNLQFKGEVCVPHSIGLSTHDCAVNNDIRGLIDSVNDGSTSAFMWEWFTTKPWVDAGEARFVSLLCPFLGSLCMTDMGGRSVLSLRRGLPG